MTTKRNWTHSLLALTLLAVFAYAGVLLAGKPDKKPPKDDPPPEITISYTMTLLGTLGTSGGTSVAKAMNEAGDVVGRVQTIAGPYELWIPFIYFSDTEEMVDLRDFLTQDDLDLWRWDLFTPRGINSGINGPIQICGGALKLNEFGDLQGYAIRITLPQQAGGFALVELVGPPDSPEGISISSVSEGINESGDVTGSYQLPGQITRAFVYTEHDGMIKDIGDLGGERAGGFAINKLGEITGYSENADGERRAFLFIPGEGMQDLGIIKKTPRIYASGSHSDGADLNDLAVVVGRSVAGTQNGSPVDHAFVEAGNGLIDLGTLDGDSDSGAMSINFDGEIVGWSVGRDSRWRGFLYTNEFGMLDLDSLIGVLPTGTNGIERWGIEINDAGEICGSYTFTNGTIQAFLLTPN